MENPKQRWKCTRAYMGEKCRSSVITVEIEGVTMMKVVNDQHKHHDGGRNHPISIGV